MEQVWPGAALWVVQPCSDWTRERNDCPLACLSGTGSLMLGEMNGYRPLPESDDIRGCLVAQAP
jgi:hypothetical protein